MSEKVIYKIENKVNGKIYIGSTKDKEERWKKHKWGLNNNCHYNQHLQRAYNKYGSDSFEFSVVEKVDEISNLIPREQHYMDNLDPEYNIASKADRSELSEETKEKMSRNHADFSGENNPIYGKHRSQETRDKISRNHADMSGENHPFYGKELSEEHRNNISENRPDMSGKNNPNYGREFSEEIRQRMSEASKGKELSEETKEKISEAVSGRKHPNYGREFSEEFKQKISEAQRGEKSPSAKLTKKKVKVILHLLEGNSFLQKEIAKMYGVKPNTISQISTGETWSHVTI